MQATTMNCESECEKEDNANNKMDNICYLTCIMDTLIDFLDYQDICKCRILSKSFNIVTNNTYFLKWERVTIVPIVYQKSHSPINIETDEDTYTKLTRIAHTCTTIHFGNILYADACGNFVVLPMQTNYLVVYDKNSVQMCTGVPTFPKFASGLIHGAEFIINMLNLDCTCAHPNLWKITLLALPSCIKTCIGIPIAYMFLFEVNIKELERRAQLGIKIPGAPLLAAVAQRSISNTLVKNLSTINFNNSCMPKRLVSTQYQIDACLWMKSVEEKGEVGFEYVDLIPWHCSQSRVVHFSPIGDTCVTQKNFPKYKKRIKTMGGILAGLGRAIDIINLILASQWNASMQISNNTLPEDSEKLKQSLLTTNSTLILVPENMHKYWLTELANYPQMQLRIVSLANMESISCCRNSDIINSDVVLCSHEILSQPTQSPLQEVQLESFSWKRVVVDEAQLLVQYNTQILDGIWSAKYWWYVSSYPYVLRRDLEFILKLLRIPEPMNINQ